MTEPLIRPARPGELRTALRLALAGPPQSAFELEKQVNGFIEYTRALNLSYDWQFLAESGGRPVAASICIAWPGRTGMVMAGPGGTAALKSTLVKLVEHTRRSVTRDDVRLFQALLPPEDTVLEAAFKDAGFSSLAILHYMERALEGSVPAVPPLRNFSNAELAIEAFDERKLDDWRGLILQSYDKSLDCPELAGMRHIDDILAGHRGAGFFSPHRWLMLRLWGQPAGVMMLGAQPLRPALEVAYTGVLPALRGRGLGRFLIQKALSLAASDGFAVVTLAVDERNHPAQAIYRAAGFDFTGSRRAMISPAIAPTS